MKDMMKLIVVSLALGTLTGCEALREQTQVRGADVVQQGGESQQAGEDCTGCRRKWSAKPGDGVNGPPLTM